MGCFVSVEIVHQETSQPVKQHSAGQDSAPGVSPSIRPGAKAHPLPLPDDAAKGAVSTSPAAAGGGEGGGKLGQRNGTSGRGLVSKDGFTDSGLRVFTFAELRTATRNFRQDYLLGEGGFGRVFKGWIDDHGEGGEAVAVKVLNTEGLQGHKEWLAEVNFLGYLHYSNLVRLVGYSAEEKQRLLVYEFMPRGSLEYHLFGKVTRVLSWNERMKIALGAARGLAYLHEEVEQQVIYRDFKASNVLLDEEFNAKLSDFGLAKDGPEGDKTHVSTRVMGTYGYAAPEYILTGHLTSKSDVYSYGVVLLELITGMRALDKHRPPEKHSLVDWAKRYFQDRRKLYRLMDPRLEGWYSVKGAQKAVTIAQVCLNPDPKARPLMSDVRDTLFQLQDLSDMAAGPEALPDGSHVQKLTTSSNSHDEQQQQLQD